MNIVPQEIEAYVKEHTNPTSALLQELEKETYLRIPLPQMLSGIVEGSLLQILIRASNAKHILEVGTFTGFSGLMMAEALPDDGQLITCEISSLHAECAQRYFARSPHGKKITLKLAPAMETLKALESNAFDFMFIDADKVNYPSYYEEGIRLIRPNGIIAIDNTLWSGEVLHPRDKDSKAIDGLNKKVRNDNRVDVVMLTVRDGLSIIKKK